MSLTLVGCGHDAFTIATIRSLDTTDTTVTATAAATPWGVTQLGAQSQIDFPTIVGDTSGNDICNDVTTDASGNVYCAGTTTGSFGEANGGGNDAFIMKTNSSGVVQWITQLGSDTQTSSAAVNNTAGNDFCMGVAVDTSGNVFCAGSTTGALGEAFGGGATDAFIMKLDSNGNIL